MKENSGSKEIGVDIENIKSKYDKIISDYKLVLQELTKSNNESINEINDMILGINKNNAYIKGLERTKKEIIQLFSDKLIYYLVNQNKMKEKCQKCFCNNLVKYIYDNFTTENFDENKDKGYYDVIKILENILQQYQIMKFYYDNKFYE